MKTRPNVSGCAARALAIRELLREAGIGPCPLTEGVVQLIAAGRQKRRNGSCASRRIRGAVYPRGRRRPSREPPDRRPRAARFSHSRRCRVPERTRCPRRRLPRFCSATGSSRGRGDPRGPA
jgi:hypothetical protein